MTVFYTKRIMGLRPANSHLGLTRLERNTHGGRCEEDLVLFIIHEKNLFDGMRHPYSLIELGSNDGTFTILSHSTGLYARRSYMIEVDNDRADVADLFVCRVRRRVPDHIYVIRQSYTDRWDFLLGNDGPLYLFLNHYHFSIIDDQEELRQRIEENCSSGSVLISFDIFFPPRSNWKEERFIITDVPREQTSWRVINRRSINSNPAQLMPLTVHKYTKMDATNYSRYNRSIPPIPISYAAFWRMNACHR